jgi:hypothetical protein
MWILLNDRPIMCSEILTVSKIYKTEFEQLGPAAQSFLNKDSYPIFTFRVNGEIRSKEYKTIEEANDARNNLLLSLNRIEASLPIINI